MANTVSKDTFWNRQKINKGVTLEIISKDLGVDKADISHYLTGMKLPPTYVSVKLCDYFGVDYATGATEFNKAHEEWVAENPGSKKKRSHIHRRKFDINRYYEPDSIESVKSAESVSAPVPSEPSITSSKRDRLLRLMYDNVDYDTYVKVVSILDS